MTAPATTLQNAPPPAALESEVPHRSGRRGLDRKRLFLWSLPILFFIAAAIIGPYIWPYDSLEVRTGDRLQPPLAILKDGSRAWLGTDKVGRDILAQILEGARISLIVGGATIVLAGSIGLTFGVLAGYRGGFSDSLLMRLADIQLAFPSILLAIMIAAVLGPSVTNVILTLSLTRWVIFARVARAATLTAKEREYVLAARATGVPPLRMLVKHIIPATIPPLLVIATVEVGLVIIAEASLSFLGLGVQPPTASWGNIINTAQSPAVLQQMPWTWIPAGVLIAVSVLSINFVGDGLRDTLDPRSRRR